jgi:transposase-like protein
VARRHEVAESCLYTWRKRFAEVAAAAADRPLLIPVSVADEAYASAEDRSR